MPERIHTRFDEEAQALPAACDKDLECFPNTDNDVNESSTMPQADKAVHPCGVAQYVRELQNYPKNSPPTIERMQDTLRTDSLHSQGIKRSRNGSPISPNGARQSIGPDLLETRRVNDVGNKEDKIDREPIESTKGAKSLNGNKEEGVSDKDDSRDRKAVGKTKDARSPNGKQDANKSRDRFTVGAKTFYGNLQSSNHALKRSDGTVDNPGKENFGSDIQSQNIPGIITSHNAISRIKINGARKLSAGTNDLRSTSIGQRTHSLILNKIKKELLEVRKALPIWPHKADIRWALRHTDVLLIVGETGSGKSTQVPQFIVSEPWFKRQTVNVETSGGRKKLVHVGGMVAVTEPRKVAATSLARRVAQETGSYLGKGQHDDKDQVGYSIRFDSDVPRCAKIKFLTEGMLLQELLHDPYLRKYSAIIIDEIHERSVDVDLLIGFLRNIVRGDKSGRGGLPLKLIVMSATANMDGLQKFFSEESSLSTSHSDHKESSGSSQGCVTAKHTGASPIVESQVKEVNGVEQDIVSTASRKVSDASYSSWDGIASDEEKTGGSNGAESASLKAEENDKVTCHNPQRHCTDKGSEFEYKDVIVQQIEGRQHPVKIYYTAEPVADYKEATLKTIFKIHTQEPLPGDILAFLTGQEEIENLREVVQGYAENLNRALPKLIVVCLYGHQSIEQQQEAFAQAKDKRVRKVVLATNVAETSITVPGVRFVIDCGKAKIKQHRARLGLQSLLVKPISKSSAIQRKGRAGREATGKCYRLYTEAEYLKLQESDTPEILRSDVVEAVLQMKARGVQDVASFPMMDPPEMDSIERALLNLHSIGALTDSGDLNDNGEKMAGFPLPAAYSRVLVAAATIDSYCLLEVIDIIACLTASEDIFLQPKSDDVAEKVEHTRHGLRRREGDIITYLTTMQQYASENTDRSSWCVERSISTRDMKQAMNIRKQLREMCVSAGMLDEMPPPDPQPFEPVSAEQATIILKSFMKAFAMKTASLQPDGSYSTTVGRHLVAIHPSSVLHGKKVEAIMFLEHVFTQKNYAKKVSAIQMDWIPEVLEM